MTLRFGRVGERPARRFAFDRRGSVTVLSAFLLPIMIAVVGLVYEFGEGLLTKAQNQRLADAAAYAGALAYNTSSSATTMAAAALNLAQLNGSTLTSATQSCPPGNPAAPKLYVCLTSSPTGDGNQSVNVLISSSNMLVLAPVLNKAPKSSGGVASTLSVSSTSYADLTAQTIGCVMALKSGGTGVTLSGGTSVTANSCSVSSNSSVTVPCGTTITTTKVTYDSSSAPSQPCGGIVAPAGKSVSIAKQAMSDPLSTNTDVTGATARLTTVEAMTSPSLTSGGSPIQFKYKQLSLTNGCTDSYSSGTHTVTCPTGGTYSFDQIYLQGGVTVVIVNSGSSPNTYDIASESCSGSTSGYASICDNGTSLRFTGPGKYVLPGGIYVSGGSTVSLSSGYTNNSYQIGYDSRGSTKDAIDDTSILIMGDAEGSNDLFTVNGNIITSGGTCLWLPDAAEHDINGYLSASGGVSLGDDSSENNVYTISDYIAFGANNGGDVTCNGQTFGVMGVNTTIVLGGLVTPSSGTCSGAAFCIGAGYALVSLSAPTTGSTANLAVIGPTSTSNTSSALFTEGSTSTSISGAFYLPNGQITLNGAGSVSSSGCLELIGSQVSLSGGSTAATACTGLSSATASAVTLVQ